MKWTLRIAFLLAVVALVTTAITYESSLNNERTQRVERIISELQQLQGGQLSAEKSKQEIIGLRIRNEVDALSSESGYSLLAPTLTGLIALITAILGVRRYFDERKKDRLERAAVDLKDILEQTVHADARVRTIGIVGLQHFFTPDKAEYHLRALSSLVATARAEQDKEVARSIRIAAEQAINILPKEVLSQVSWQGVRLEGVNFSSSDKLAGLDFRDAILENANFSYCDLSGADFTAARLMGARFYQATMHACNLTYADLAGADLSHADLEGATLQHIMVWDMNLEGAILPEKGFDPQAVDWSLTRNWRRARFPEDVRKALIDRHGPDPTGLKVLMLMWEIPPLVAGGTWTACYHWVRKLRLLGVNLTVVVPWDNSLIMANPFGADVEVVSLGIKPHVGMASPYSQATGQGNVWNIYGSYGSSSPFAANTPYGQQAAYPFSAYGSPGYSAASPYGGSAPYNIYSAYGNLARGTSVLRIADMYARRLERFVRDKDFNIIHAHDWVTFGAAEKAGRAKQIPWMAHFHSTEFDRREEWSDPIIARIEKRAADSADLIVTPSKVTAVQVRKDYHVKKTKISVVPNVISQEFIDPNEIGVFETASVVFLGRLAWQKAPDRFALLADRYRRRDQRAHFLMWGEGEYANELRYSAVALMGVLPWQNRGRAFDGASVVYVPSRAEPFGLVIVEAMQHRVPVLYPKNSGVAEVIRTDLMIDPQQLDQVENKLRRLLTDWQYWEDMVEAQEAALSAFIARQDERALLALWNRVVSSSGSVSIETRLQKPVT